MAFGEFVVTWSVDGAHHGDGVGFTAFDFYEVTVLSEDLALGDLVVT